MNDASLCRFHFLPIFSRFPSLFYQLRFCCVSSHPS